MDYGFVDKIYTLRYDNKAVIETMVSWLTIALPDTIMTLLGDIYQWVYWEGSSYSKQYHYNAAADFWLASGHFFSLNCRNITKICNIIQYSYCWSLNQLFWINSVYILIEISWYPPTTNSLLCRIWILNRRRVLYTKSIEYN